jgi:hypothetical protein
MSQWGLSGTRKRRPQETTGTTQLTNATVLHAKNVPSKNCARIPEITATVLVEAKIPLRLG